MTNDVLSRIDVETLKQVDAFFSKLGKRYYVHAGTALVLHGLPGELDDIDVKVFSDDLNDVYLAAKEFFDCGVVLTRDVVKNFGTYLFPLRIEVALATEVDICSRTGAVKSDLGECEFPFSEDIFENAVKITVGGMVVPVASIENLFLYYLVLRRDATDGKDDEEKIKDILSSGKFSEELFDALLHEHPNKEAIMRIYAGYRQFLSSPSK